MRIAALIQTMYHELYYCAENISNPEKKNWNSNINRYCKGKAIIMAIIFKELLDRFNVKSEIVYDRDITFYYLRITSKPVSASCNNNTITLAKET